MASLILVTGAARSGKSEWAEQCAARSPLAVTYIATAQVNESDAEWQERIRLHQQRRSPDWQTLHVPFDLATTVQMATEQHCLLIDSLGTWLANFLEEDPDTWQQTTDHLLQALHQTRATVIIVAEETGWGVVPAYPIGRMFRDRLGALTRDIGAIADRVYLVVAGYALDLTQLGTPLLPRDRESL